MARGSAQPHKARPARALAPLLVVIATLPGPVSTASLPLTIRARSGSRPADRCAMTATAAVLQTTVFRATATRERLSILVGACADPLAGMAVCATVGVDRARCRRVDARDHRRGCPCRPDPAPAAGPSVRRSERRSKGRRLRGADRHAVRCRRCRCASRARCRCRSCAPPGQPGPRGAARRAMRICISASRTIGARGRAADRWYSLKRSPFSFPRTRSGSVDRSYMAPARARKDGVRYRPIGVGLEHSLTLLRTKGSASRRCAVSGADQVLAAPWNCS